MNNQNDSIMLNILTEFSIFFALEFYTNLYFICFNFSEFFQLHQSQFVAQTIDLLLLIYYCYHI